MSKTVGRRGRRKSQTRSPRLLSARSGQRGLRGITPCAQHDAGPGENSAGNANRPSVVTRTLPLASYARQRWSWAVESLREAQIAPVAMRNVHARRPPTYAQRSGTGRPQDGQPALSPTGTDSERNERARSVHYFRANPGTKWWQAPRRASASGPRQRGARALSRSTPFWLCETGLRLGSRIDRRARHRLSQMN